MNRDELLIALACGILGLLIGGTVSSCSWQVDCDKVNSHVAYSGKAYDCKERN